MTERYLARRILHQGERFQLSILEVMFRDGVYEVKITPFEREIHSTSYHGGTIAVCSRKCDPSEAELPENRFHKGPEPPVLIFF